MNSQSFLCLMASRDSKSLERRPSDAREYCRRKQVIHKRMAGVKCRSRTPRVIRDARLFFSFGEENCATGDAIRATTPPSSASSGLLASAPGLPRRRLPNASAKHNPSLVSASAENGGST